MYERAYNAAVLSAGAEHAETLNLHLASLRARSVETPTEVHSLSDRVRALCDDIGRQELALAAGDELETLERVPRDTKMHS